jgi:hypothetical protein
MKRRWHISGWEVRCDQPTREPRCRCDRCEWRITVMAMYAAKRLVEEKAAAGAG